MTRAGRFGRWVTATAPLALAVTVGLGLAACGGSASSAATPSHVGTARILLAGDVMLGRGVASRTASDPTTALTGVRDVVQSADLAAANLESPLTTHPHLAGSGPHALEAAPAAAAVLAQAGFDVVGVANNHAGDAGPATVTDTTTALSSAGLVSVGGGRDAREAFAARVVTVHGLRVALLAVDATGAGPRAGPTSPGVAWWDEARLHSAVLDARRRADVVVVGLHGGTEYLAGPDRQQTDHAKTLARWGVDVVWGHHPHVIQPVAVVDPDGDGRPTVVAPSLGNLVFDQHAPATTRGLVLEVQAGREGVRAMRRGEVRIADGRASFERWLDPDAGADAALLGGTWWQLTPVAPRPVNARLDAATTSRITAELSPALVLDTSLGDVDGDGSVDVVAAFRRPYRPTPVSEALPRSRLVDAAGRSAHVGVYRRTDLRQTWVAGTVLEPVGALAVCGGWLAVGLTPLDDARTVVGLGAWKWGGFGFVTYPELFGTGHPACADVDADGSLDPVAVERTAA